VDTPAHSTSKAFLYPSEKNSCKSGNLTRRDSPERQDTWNIVDRSRPQIDDSGTVADQDQVCKRKVDVRSQGVSGVLEPLPFCVTIIIKSFVKSMSCNMYMCIPETYVLPSSFRLATQAWAASWTMRLQTPVDSSDSQGQPSTARIVKGCFCGWCCSRVLNS